jgi:hypothetical protein
VVALVVGHLGDHRVLGVGLVDLDPMCVGERRLQQRPRRLELDQRAERVEQHGLVPAAGGGQGSGVRHPSQT